MFSSVVSNRLKTRPIIGEVIAKRLPTEAHLDFSRLGVDQGPRLLLLVSVSLCTSRRPRKASTETEVRTRLVGFFCLERLLRSGRKGPSDKTKQRTEPCHVLGPSTSAEVAGPAFVCCLAVHCNRDLRARNKRLESGFAHVETIRAACNANDLSGSLQDPPR